MRQIGSVGTRSEAQRLAAYLLTRGIKSQVDPDGDQFAVWVFDEDQLPAAREDFAKFKADPNLPEFIAAEDAASKFLDEQLQKRRNQPQIIDVRERWRRPSPASQPVTMLLLGISIGVTIWTNFGGAGGPERPSARVQAFIDNLKIASFQPTRTEVRAQGLSQIREGEVWRLFTPMFLHFSLPHILFNMMWLYELGMMIEFRRGSGRFLVLVLLLAALSNLCQYYWGLSRMSQSGMAPMEFGGMSGVIYGLMGYVWVKSRYYPLLAMRLSPNTVLFAVIFLVLCMLDFMGPIANAAHVSGLIAGLILGLVPFL